MATSWTRDPTLMGIPKELRMKIFEKLFEDEWLQEQYASLTESIYQWPNQILSTCKTLHDEAEEARIAKVFISEINCVEASPSCFETEAEFGPGDDGWDLYGDHVRFLRKNGKLIRRVRGYNVEFLWCSHLEWFPDLETLTLSGFIELKLSKKSVNYCAEKIDKARFFEAFEKWYKSKNKDVDDDEDGDESRHHNECELQDGQIKEIAGRKGIDRKYGVYVELELEVTDVGNYVSRVYPSIKSCT